MNRLAGKVAIVTGAGSGIGRATAELFAEQGAAVAIAERDRARADEVAAAIARAGGRAAAIPTDVADEESVRRMVAETTRQLGGVHLLVNCAAVFVLKGIDGAPEDWRAILDVNVMGPALCVKHAAPEIAKAGGGAIVNIGSISSFIAQPDKHWTYNASKAAMISLTRCMALDLARHKIRVNSVCPGAVWTPIVQQITSEMGLDRAGADAHPAWGGAHILKRIADPREIAQAILFLASDDASFVTGENMMVDGGYTAI